MIHWGYGAASAAAMFGAGIAGWIYDNWDSWFSSEGGGGGW